MKAYEWLVFVRSYGKWLLQDILENKGDVKIIMGLLDLLSKLSSHYVSKPLMQSIRKLMNDTLDSIENELPSTEHDIIVHLMSHIPDQMEDWGPVRGYWMFNIERYFSWCNQSMKQPSHPEANLYNLYLRTFSCNKLQATFEFDQDKFLSKLIWPEPHFAHKDSNGKNILYPLDKTQVESMLNRINWDYNHLKEKLLRDYNAGKSSNKKKSVTLDQFFIIKGSELDSKYTIFRTLPTHAGKSAYVPHKCCIQTSCLFFYFFIFISFLFFC